MVGAVLPITGDAHHDQAWVQCVQRFPAQAPAFQHAGAEVFNDDIALQGQFTSNLLAFGLAQIQRNGTLVATLHAPPQGGVFVQLPPAAQRVALAGRFDLDDIGPKLGQQAAGIGAGNQGTQLQDFDAFERGFGKAVLIHFCFLQLLILG